MKKNKQKYDGKKLMIYSILFFVLVCLPRNIFAATIELTENSAIANEMRDIVLELNAWINDSENVGKTEGDLAKEIVRLCNNDPEKIQKLQHSYTYNGGGAWNGDDPASSHYNAANLAVESNKNDSQIESGSQDDQDKMLKELSDMSNIAYSKDSTVEELKKLDAKLKEYKDKYGISDYMLKDMALKVKERLEALGETGKTTIDEIVEREEEREEYEETSRPSTGHLGSPTDSSTIHTPDEIITEANEFVQQGTTSPIDGERLKGASSTLYNLLLSIGIFLSVAIGVYLGVKFMLSTAEDKAKVKESLIPYIVGCIVIFSAFIIWKAVIMLIGGIS